MPLPKVPQKFLPKLTSVFLLLYVAATLPLLANRLTSFAYMVQAVVQKKQNAENEATESLKQAIQPNFWDATIYQTLGLHLSNRGKVEEAISAYRQAIRLYPEYGSAYLDLGESLAKQGKFDEEMATYRQAIKVNPQLTWPYHKLGRHFYFSWRGADILAVSLRNRSIGDRAEAYTAEAKAVYYLQQAIATYRQAIQTNPNYAEGYSNLGKILLEAGRLDEAIAIYQKAIQLNPKNDILYNNIGISFYNQGKLDEASAAFHQAIQLNPKNIGAHHNLAWTLQQQGKIEQAIDIYKLVTAFSEFKRDNLFYITETERLSSLWKNPQLLAISERFTSLKDRSLVSLKRSVVRVIVKSSGEWESGTGWVVKRQGNKAWIVTNRHVATTIKNQPQSDPNEISFQFPSDRPQSDQKFEVEFYSEPHSGEFRKRLPAKISQITEPSNKLDLALLEVTDIPRDIKPLARSSASVALKAPIRIIGYPNNADNWTVATGEVIKKTDQQLELSAIVAAGNSGSPVLDRQNRVVGIVWGTHYINQTQKQNQDKSGLALAFPLQSVTKQLKDWGID